MRKSALVAVLAVSMSSAAFAVDELAIGAKGPGFDLKGTDGKMYSLDSIKGRREPPSSSPATSAPTPRDTRTA